jgi:hypothetical protein
MPFGWLRTHLNRAEQTDRTAVQGRDASKILDSFPPTWDAVGEGEVTESKSEHLTDSGTADSDEELFQIIDESGEGWGFELEPATVIKPLAMASAALFGFGMLAGIPAGIAIGQIEEGPASSNRSGRKLKPTAGGVFFAFRAFVYGTLLCGAFGATAAYATAYYYDTWTWKDFGDAMRVVVPKRRLALENAVTPWLEALRRGASERLPEPISRARDRFGDSRVGIYIKNKIERSTEVEVDTSAVSRESRNGKER